jgi:uncharacterized membrane protein HdeD (DUF308 family)
MVRRLARLWWLLMAKGLLAIAAGALVIAWPGVTLWELVGLFGASALVDGVVSLGLGLGGGWGGHPWWEMVALGLVGIIIGMGTLAWPGVTVLVLLAFVACWAIARGLVEIAGAIALRQVIEGEWLLALSGALSVTFGILLLARPAAGAPAFAVLIGLYLIAFGATAAALAVRIRTFARMIPG